MEFDKQHLNWMHDEEAPTEEDLERIRIQEQQAEAGNAGWDLPDIAAAAAEAAEGKPRLYVEADWDPDAHPRGPDGKFIQKLENMFDIVPDEDQATDRDVREAIEEMADEGQRVVDVKDPEGSELGHLLVEDEDEEIPDTFQLADPTTSGSSGE